MRARQSDRRRCCPFVKLVIDSRLTRFHNRTDFSLNTLPPGVRMIRIFLVAVAVTMLLLIGFAAPQSPLQDSKTAAEAAEEYQAIIVKLDEDFHKDVEPLKADYVKALTEAKKLALEKNDVEEAKRITEAVKGLDGFVSPAQIVSLRHRLANTTWEWEPQDPKATITFQADGTVTTTGWLKGEKGTWHVNPDLSVHWWSSGEGHLFIMKFNENFTAHEASIPKEGYRRVGKRLN